MKLGEECILELLVILFGLQIFIVPFTFQNVEDKDIQNNLSSYFLRV
jgi:hypothetical protein